MKTILIRFYNPDEVMDVTPETTDEEIIECCFRVNEYVSEGDALMAYANTQVAWSTLLDKDADWKQFIKDAYSHIQNNDIDWLEQHFV